MRSIRSSGIAPGLLSLMVFNCCHVVLADGLACWISKRSRFNKFDVDLSRCERGSCCSIRDVEACDDEPSSAAADVEACRAAGAMKRRPCSRAHCLQNRANAGVAMLRTRRTCNFTFHQKHLGKTRAGCML